MPQIRHTPTNLDLNGSVNESLAELLEPFVNTASTKGKYHDQGELWDTIGGMSGVRAIRTSARAVAILSARMAESSRSAEDAALEIEFLSRAIAREAFWIRFEAWRCERLPLWPRNHAYSLARNYCDLMMLFAFVRDM